MFKKIFLTLTLIFSLSITPLPWLNSSSGVALADNIPLPPAKPSENLDSPNFMFNLSSITNQNLEGSTRQSWIRRGINYFFERIIGFMAAVIGTLAVFMMTLGGFLMLSSAGNEQRYEQGKNYVKYSLIGLAAALLAYVLVTLVQLLIRSIYG